MKWLLGVCKGGVRGQGVNMVCKEGKGGVKRGEVVIRGYARGLVRVELGGKE